jgi:hypothetical protein
VTLTSTCNIPREIQIRVVFATHPHLTNLSHVPKVGSEHLYPMILAITHKDFSGGCNSDSYWILEVQWLFP